MIPVVFSGGLRSCGVIRVKRVKTLLTQYHKQENFDESHVASGSWKVKEQAWVESSFRARLHLIVMTHDICRCRRIETGCSLSHPDSLKIYIENDLWRNSLLSCCVSVHVKYFDLVIVDCREAVTSKQPIFLCDRVRLLLYPAVSFVYFSPRM